MDSKGEVNTAGLILLFVGIIVGLVLIQAVGPFIGQTTGTQSLVNHTFTAPAVGSKGDLIGQELLSTPIVYNSSNVTDVVSATNYTIAETISSVDGLKRISYTSLTGSKYASKNVNITYDYGMEGYADDAGARSVIGLILIVAALGLVAFILYYIFKDSNILDHLGI